MNWIKTISDLTEILKKMEITDHRRDLISHDLGFKKWLSLADSVKRKNRYLFLVGNGASSSMASHFATDITKNGGIKTHVFTDSSLLSAVGNDYCFDELYMRPLQWYSEKDDLLVAISSSGNSENIVTACKYARYLGLKIVTLSAMKPDNKLRKLGDLNFYIKADTYGFAESGHAVVLHHWMDMVETSQQQSIVRLASNE